MKYKEWINKSIESGKLCGEYQDKISNAKSKKQIMDIVLDASGLEWFMEMQSHRMCMPYETITNDFKSYINGRYIAECGNKQSNKYTSSLYCCYCEDTFIEINTTQTAILGCTCDVYLPNNEIHLIYVDKNCDLTIHCPDNSRAKVEYWSGAKIEIDGRKENVELIEHK